MRLEENDITTVRLHDQILLVASSDYIYDVQAHLNVYWSRLTYQLSEESQVKSIQL